MFKPTFIIAEAGVNHNGDVTLAKRLVDAAASSGADAVKFQTWRTELLVTPTAEMAEYQMLNTQVEESQFDMLKRLELSYNDFNELKLYCDNKKILFLSTADEEESASFLNNLQDIFKIGSGELTNIPFLRHVAQFGKEIILSTGMANLAETEEAIRVLLSSGQTLDQITVLHATTAYPTFPEDVNLNAMTTLRHAFPGIKVGYSDHTLGIEVSLAAVALGAKVIEKHFTLNRDMKGPDHAASLEPDELGRLIDGVRKIEKALGSGWKAPTLKEIENKKIVRKSIVAKEEISIGDILTTKNVTIMRAGGGISPNRWDEVLGSKAIRSYKKGDII